MRYFTLNTLSTSSRWAYLSQRGKLHDYQDGLFLHHTEEPDDVRMVKLTHDSCVCVCVCVCVLLPTQCNNGRGEGQ